MRRTFFFLFVSLFAFAASGEDFGDFYVVPIAGHTEGLAGSFWQTDLIVYNFQDVPVTIEAGLVQSGLSTADNFATVVVDGGTSFTVAAGATRVIADVLRGHRGRESALGALLVGGDRPFALSARIYNVAGQSPSVGVIVPVAQEFLSAPSQRAFIPGLVSSRDFRSNIGFLAVAGSVPLVLEVTLESASGTTLGVLTFAVPSDAIAHIQMSSLRWVAGSFDVASVVMRFVSGTGNVTGYASMVDNRTNNLAFLSSGFPGSPSLQPSMFEMVLRADAR